MTERAAPVEPGQIIAGKFRIERVLGSGGMGVVVAAHHLQLGRLVALKFLLRDACGKPEVARRFVREGQALARLTSPHVARIMDVGTLSDGEPYLVMEYLDGSDLGAVLHDRKQLPVPEAISYVLQACEAIAEAHANGIVHRDLKPSNLFLTLGADGLPLIKVLDFGISKATAESGGDTSAHTNTGAIVGSPLYMSPEQVRDARRVDSRTDIWALGVILHELLCGEPPFRGDTVSGTLAAVAADAPQPIRARCPDAPPALEAVVLRCLMKNAPERYDSVATLASALAEFAPEDASASVARIARLLGAVSQPVVVKASQEAEPGALALSATLPAWEGHAVSTQLEPPASSLRLRKLLAVTAPLAAVAAYLVLSHFAAPSTRTAASAAHADLSAAAPASTAPVAKETGNELPAPTVPTAAAVTPEKAKPELTARPAAPPSPARLSRPSQPAHGTPHKPGTEDDDGTSERR